MLLFKKLFDTLRPLYDFRALLLLFIGCGVGLVVDPVATLGLAGYLAYVIGMAGVSLILSKLLMPYLRISVYARAALIDGNVAAAIVLLARVILILGILCILVIWGK